MKEITIFEDSVCGMWFAFNDEKAFKKFFKSYIDFYLEETDEVPKEHEDYNIFYAPLNATDEYVIEKD